MNNAREITGRHQAAATGKLATVEYFARLNASHVTERDYNGMMPIHLAISEKCSLPIVAFLVTNYPSQATATTKDGRTPLQLAAVITQYGCQAIRNYLQDPSEEN